QHTLRVVAGGLVLDDGRAAGRIEAGEQDGRLDLRRGDRRLVDDRHGLARALERDGAAAAFGLRDDARAHPDQRVENAAHGPLAQGGVAIEGRGDRVAADDAHHQARAGARIAEVEHAGRAREAADADTPYTPAPLAEPLHIRAERAGGVRRAQY